MPRSRDAVPVLLLALGVLPAGCGPRLDRQKLGTDIENDMAQKGVTLTGVTCPQAKLEKGTTFQCTGADSDGTPAIFDVTATGDSKGTVTWKLRGKFENMQVVGDRLEKSLSTRMNQPVDVTCPSKNILIAKGVTFECDATVGGGKTMKFVFTAQSDQGDWTSKVQGG
ncbi:MAG TPA: DUF4333 domain-containing protein [Polyangiaceae bacterium]|jgi:hypothetical protein